MICTAGCNNVQLRRALRWMTAARPPKGFAEVNRVNMRVIPIYVYCTAILEKRDNTRGVLIYQVNYKKVNERLQAALAQAQGLAERTGEIHQRVQNIGLQLGIGLDAGTFYAPAPIIYAVPRIGREARWREKDGRVGDGAQMAVP